MARKNRLVVMDGLYHITARVAHQERLLRDPAFKKLIVDPVSYAAGGRGRRMGRRVRLSASRGCLVENARDGRR